MRSLIIAIVTATLMVSTPAFSELELKGRMEQGGMVVGRTEAESEIFLDGRRVRVGDDGQFVFGFSWLLAKLPWKFKPWLPAALLFGTLQCLELAISWPALGSLGSLFRP